MYSVPDVSLAVNTTIFGAVAFEEASAKVIFHSLPSVVAIYLTLFGFRPTRSS